MDRERSLALVVREPGRMEIGYTPAVARRGSEVRVASTLSGFSTGTDKWVMSGRFRWADISFPLVPGYQVVGRVDAVPSDGSELQVGQSVVVLQAQAPVGFAAVWGCHAASVTASSENVFDATGVPELSAALIVSAQVGFNAASRVAAASGSEIAVIGDGIIGASAALAALARGYRVVLLGRHDARLEPLADLGIRTVNVGRTGTAVAPAWSPAAVIDTAQTDDSLQSYLEALEPGRGQIVYSGHSPGGIRHWGDMAEFQKRELRVDFVSGWTADRIEATLAAMRSGALPLDTLVGERATTAAEATALAVAVESGGLAPTAAVIDWREI